MPRNIKPPMMSTHFLTSLCALLGFLVIAAQARTLPAESPRNKFKLVITYGRTLSPPPPSPTTSPPTEEVTSISTCTAETQCNNFAVKTNYERPLNSPLPPPKSGPPIIHQIMADCGRDKSLSPPPTKSTSSSVHLEIASPCLAGSLCKGVISMVTDYGRTATTPPPPPKSSSSHVQLETDYGKTATSPPPPPKPSSPIGQLEISSPCVAGSQCDVIISRITDYERTATTPPPPPKSSSSPVQLETDYGKTATSPPPPPKPSSPIGQLEISSPCVAGSQCDVIISKITNYGRSAKSPPPSPKPSSPTHHATSDEQLAHRRSPPYFYLASS